MLHDNLIKEYSYVSKLHTILKYKKCKCFIYFSIYFKNSLKKKLLCSENKLSTSFNIFFKIVLSIENKLFVFIILRIHVNIIIFNIFLLLLIHCTHQLN